MAEKTYYNGIPDIPADAETKVITEPYKLDPNAKYESDKFLTGEETRRRALVTGSWKLDTGALQYDLPKPLEISRSIGVAAEDSARHTLAQFVNEVLTSPGKTATGTAIGALTWKALTPVAENALAKTIGTRAASSLLGKIGTGVVGGAAAAGVAGAAGYAFFPTPAGDAIEGSGGSPEMFKYSMKQSHARKAQQAINQATKDFNDKKITQEELDKVTQENQPVIDEFNAVEQKKRQSDVNSVYAKLQNAKNVLEQAKQDLSEGKITQKEFDDRQEFFDRTVSSHLEYAKQLDYFNDAVKMLEGAPYPTQSIAEDIIASTSEFIQNRDFLREIQNIQKGVDPDNVLNVTASTIGRMVPIIATSAFTGRFTRLGRKQFFKSLVNDPEFKTVVFRPVKSAKQAAAAAEKAGLIGTYMQELGDIAWEEKQKYIEETGDVDLINYVPSDDLSKYAYSAAAAQIEFMGGVEPLFAGGLRRALRTGGVRTALKAGALTGAEEIAEEMEQGFSRFLTQKMSGTTDKTWGEGLKEILISMAYAGPIGFGFGSAVHAYGRRQLIKGLTEYGLSPETAAKVADNMIDQVETANNPQLETVRDNLRSKIAVLYEDKDLSEAEKEDAIETQTDLEMSWLVTEAAEKGYAPEESPLLQGVVNEIGYFRTGIPEQITDDVARLNNEIADLRQQLRDENAKEQKDFNKIEELESKIEQFYAKLPQDIANIVETDRTKVRQMLSEQSERAMDISNRRKIASQVRQRALRAMQKQDESELQQSLRRLQEQTRKEERETRAEERKQRTEQRKLRGAIEKMRQNVLKRKERMPAFQEMFADPDLVYKALRDSGFTDEQIATMPQDDIVKAVLPYGISPQILKQTKVSGKGKDFRGFYVPDYRLIVLSPDADVTTLTHEFAHDWLQQFFRHYRSGKASESFMKSWGAVEKALGISPDAITVPDEASEAFARAYEGWVLNKKDWAKNIDVDDENREQLIERFKRYQEYLTDIYEDLTNPYFRETWGKVGELKPELQAWFEQVTMADDVISAKVASGAITPEQAQIRTISKNVNDVVQAAEDNFTQKEKDEINAVERLNDTSRYEVPGGNKNSLQNRLSGLARDIDANNVALGRYDTHRDMLEVAKAADEFVRTRTDEALNIINGIEPEKEGLYASDLYTALERFATETNNVDLAMELINSKVAQDLAKEWGQRVAGFRNFTGDGDFDTISQLKALDNQYKKDYDEKEKQKVNTAADEYVTELNNADDAQDVDAFLDSIKCQ